MAKSQKNSQDKPEDQADNSSELEALQAQHAELESENEALNERVQQLEAELEAEKEYSAKLEDDLQSVNTIEKDAVKKDVIIGVGPESISDQDLADMGQEFRKMVKEGTAKPEHLSSILSAHNHYIDNGGTNVEFAKKHKAALQQLL